MQGSSEKTAVENLLNRRMAKAVSMMGLPARDAENVCTRCGTPDVPSCESAETCATAGWREVERLHTELAAAYDRIDELSALLGDLLNDCDNWGIVPHTRYEEVIRYVNDPTGNITMTTLDPYGTHKVRVELVTPGDGQRVDASGTRAAPCSGRHHNNWCTTCGHDPGDHNEDLICLVCHQLCDYCGMFRDQHERTEWASCQRDLEAVENPHAE